MLAVSQAALGGRSTALGGGISALEMDRHSYCAGFFPRVKCDANREVFATQCSEPPFLSPLLLSKR